MIHIINTYRRQIGPLWQAVGELPRGEYPATCTDSAGGAGRRRAGPDATGSPENRGDASTFREIRFSSLSTANLVLRPAAGLTNIPPLLHLGERLLPHFSAID